MIADPNNLEVVDLAWIEPNEDNVRLFVERLSLRALEEVYSVYAQGKPVVLPDAPITRLAGFREDSSPRLVLLAGERRTTAARNVGVKRLPVRVVDLTDEDAFKFILRHNNVVGLTTIELAFRAVEMDRLGFSHDEIAVELGSVALHRYLTVGEMVNPDLLTDAEKLCNPSIVEWYEAASFGPAHFNHCFQYWDAGWWDEKICAREFRKRGKVLPLDNAERGFRVTFDGNRLVVRGQLDLTLMDEDIAHAMLVELESNIERAQTLLDKGENFGDRKVFLINPTTV